MKTLLSHAVLTVLAAFCTISGFAQITVDPLNPAVPYDVSLLAADESGLNSALWQNTTARQAIRLMENIDADASSDALILVRAALLSGGVPPVAEDDLDRDAYTAARLQTLLKFGAFFAFDKLAKNAGVQQSNPAFIKPLTERALLGEDWRTACGIADMVMTERKSPYWAKLRAYCHYKRDELPAAELTADIVRRSAHKDDTFFVLLGCLSGNTLKEPDFAKLATPLHMAMAVDYLNKSPDIKMDTATLPKPMAAIIARNSELEADVRFATLKRAVNLLSVTEFEHVLSGFSDVPLVNVRAFTGKSKWTPEIWSRVVRSAKSSTDATEVARLVELALENSIKVGLFEQMADLFAREIRLIPHTLQVNANADAFAQIAVRNRDLTALRGLHEALSDENPLKDRIALAFDALSGGFLMSDLGSGIEMRLTTGGKTGVRAVRDTYIAAVLGAIISEKAENIVSAAQESQTKTAPEGEMLLLKLAARKGAKAETALRTAKIIAGGSAGLSDHDLADLLLALNDAGMTDQARQIAAADFLRR